MAESPPPTTAIAWSRKKKPSQVAQVETPWPRRAAPRSAGPASGRGAGGDDHGCGARCSSSCRPHDSKRPLREVDVVTSSMTSRRRSARPARAALHQLRALDALGEAGEVLDVGGEHQLPAGAPKPSKTSGAQVGAGGVDCRGVARGPDADDDHVVDVGQTLLLVPLDTHGGMVSTCPSTCPSARARSSPPSCPGIVSLKRRRSAMASGRVSALRAETCVECGYTELYAEKPERLFSDLRQAAEERAGAVACGAGGQPDQTVADAGGPAAGRVVAAPLGGLDRADAADVHERGGAPRPASPPRRPPPCRRARGRRSGT